MRSVQTEKEILDNMELLDKYLSQKTESTYSFALGLIKRGTCFIANKTENGYCFYPSRFVGYANNSMDRHLNNPYKDGRETNPAISFVLDQKLMQDLELEKEYRKYCERLGFVANEKGNFGVQRKYWKINL